MYSESLFLAGLLCKKKNGSQHYFFLRHFSAHLTARAQLRSWLPHRCAPLLVQHPAPLHSFWSPSSWLAGRRLYLVETHCGERKNTQRRSAHVTAVTRELRNFPGFKPGNCRPTLAEAPRPERPPPACRTQPHCGNCSRFYWGRRKSSQLDDACSFREVSEAALKSLCSHLRICRSNWTVFCVSFSRGTVKRRPAHSCKEGDCTH